MTTAGGGGSIVLLDPEKGSIISSLRIAGDMSGKSPLGISSLSMFPPNFASLPNHAIAMGFGVNANKRDDSYGVLLSLRSGSLPPVLHWKARLPEAQLTAGLSVSPCGCYAVGGGASGVIYVWFTIGGTLLSIAKAHYRSVTVLEWTPCGRYLVTGGADGMVHMFSLIDLVDQSSKKKSSIQPIRSFSHHQLPITALTPLSAHRFASASSDGQVVIIQLYSESVLATIQLPHSIECLTSSRHTIFAGSSQGDIYCIDLDAYALYQTAQRGATLTSPISQIERVFGTANISEEQAYVAELKGHDRCVTALVAVDESRLCSGDSRGQVRLWDLTSRSCIGEVTPWTHSSHDASTASHPITSLRVVELDDDVSIASSMFRSDTSKANQKSMVTLISPLQKYVPQESILDQVPMCLMEPQRTLSRVSEDGLDYAAALQQRRATGTNEEATRLRRELQTAHETIQRWEAVNNKLLAQLKK